MLNDGREQMGLCGSQTDIQGEPAVRGRCLGLQAGSSFLHIYLSPSKSKNGISFHQYFQGR